MERTLERQPLPSCQMNRSQWLKLYAELCGYQRNLRTRRQLACLGSEQLADAGITEQQRYLELCKPFWR